MDQYNTLINGEALVLVEFFATWCPHCQAENTVLDTLEDERPQLRVVRFDVDDPVNENLIKKLHIESIPALMLYYKGEKVWGDTGEVPLNDLLEKVDKYSGTSFRQK